MKETRVGTSSPRHMDVPRRRRWRRHREKTTLFSRCHAGPGRSPDPASSSERGVVRLAGTNTNDSLDLGDENLAVADLPRFGGLHDGIDDLVDQVAAYRDLVAGLGYEVDHVFGAAIQLGMAALSAISLHLSFSHA